MSGCVGSVRWHSSDSARIGEHRAHVNTCGSSGASLSRASFVKKKSKARGMWQTSSGRNRTNLDTSASSIVEQLSRCGKNTASEGEMSQAFLAYSLHDLSGSRSRTW